MLSIHRRTAGMLAICCCACRSTFSSSGEPASTHEIGAETGRAGTPVGAQYYQLQASLPVDCPPTKPARVSATTRRVGIELALAPTSTVQVPANPYYARLVDAERNVYEATLGGCGEPLAPALPALGQTARGWVVFELPRATRPITLLYAPELVGVQKTELAIELQRR